MNDEQLLDLYNNKLNPTERKYYEAWTYWKRFKVQPWRFLNKRVVTRDMLLALSQIDGIYHTRMQVKEKKDKTQEQQNTFRPLAAQQSLQITSQRANRTISVL